jgi:hypothetical protein
VVRPAGEPGDDAGTPLAATLVTQVAGDPHEVLVLGLGVRLRELAL